MLKWFGLCYNLFINLNYNRLQGLHLNRQTKVWTPTKKNLLAGVQTLVWTAKIKSRISTMVTSS